MDEERSFPEQKTTIDPDEQLYKDILSGKITLEQFKAIRETEKQELQRQRELSTIDELTGLRNRRGIKLTGEEVLARYKRFGHGLFRLELDLDKFKDVNDTLGHPVGDELLKYVAKVLQDSTRAEDIVGRLGGDEFVVLLQDTDLKGAQLVAQRIREGVITISKQMFPDGSLNPTTSIGIAQASKDDTFGTLTHKADRALYMAKKLGRNRSEVFSEEMLTSK